MGGFWLPLLWGVFWVCTASAEFRVERVRGVYSFRRGVHSRLIQKSSSQRKLPVGTVLAMQEGTFDESQSELTQSGVQFSLLGGSTVELTGQRSLRRWAGPLRVRTTLKASPFVVRLVPPRVAEPLSAQCAPQTACDWVVFERPAEPQAERGAQDPEVVLVVLQGKVQLTRWQRGDDSRQKNHAQKTEVLLLRSRDQYAHSLYSGGQFSPRPLPAGEAEVFYRQWGWEP